MAVAVFLTGDLGGRDFFQQCSSTADDFFRRKGQAGDAGLQVFDVFVQTVGQFAQTLGAVFRKQRVFDAVETGEIFGFHAFFVVVDAGVDGRIEVTEQFGNRLD
ncbi:hypothetical protein D3C86_895300 [compost metagenome]